jgi:hypothetical protein
MSFLGVGIVVVFSGVAIAQSPSASSSVPAKAGADDKAIRPFHFTASKEALADLRKRINATKWPELETVTDTSQGVQVATMLRDRFWFRRHDEYGTEPQNKGVSKRLLRLKSKVRAGLA